MSNISKCIEKQMRNPEFCADHESTRAEFEKSQKEFQELQRYRKSSPIERDYKKELAEALEEKYAGSCL